MKKLILMLIMILTCLLFAGCGGGDGGNGDEASKESAAGIPASGAEALAGIGIEDLSGSYEGTMTMTKVGVVYDSEDMDEEGNVLHYYKPEGTSEWEGESVDVAFEIALEGDEVNVLSGDGETAFNVTYDPLTGAWGSSKSVPPGTEITAGEFSKVDGKAHIKIIFTSTYENTEVPDGVNEMIIEITKVD